MQKKIINKFKVFEHCAGAELSTACPPANRCIKKNVASFQHFQQLLPGNTTTASGLSAICPMHMHFTMGEAQTQW